MLSLVSITVEGCPQEGPAAILSAPNLTVVREYGWDGVGVVSPAALFVKGGEVGSANFTVNVSLGFLGGGVGVGKGFWWFGGSSRVLSTVIGVKEV